MTDNHSWYNLRESRAWWPKKTEPRVRAVAVYRLSISVHSQGTGLALSRVVALTNQFRSGPWRHSLGAVAVQSCVSELITVWRDNLKGKQTAQIFSDSTRQEYRRGSPLYVWISLRSATAQWCPSPPLSRGSEWPQHCVLVYTNILTIPWRKKQQISAWSHSVASRNTKILINRPTDLPTPIFTLRVPSVPILSQSNAVYAKVNPHSV